MNLAVGQTFSLAITDNLKCYTWGLNDNLQLARNSDPSNLHCQPDKCTPLQNLEPKILTCGDDHALMIDYNGNVYAWGANDRGQLGLGHTRPSRNIVNLSRLGKNVKYIQTKGSTSYVINSQGQVMKWPNPEHLEKFCPVNIPLRDSSVTFTSLAAGNGFVVALSQNGLLWSQGRNTFGQLGLGDFNKRDGFDLIRYFKTSGEKVTQVSAGFAHVICKGSAGKIFTWGLNDQGQLGSGLSEPSNSPIIPKITDNKNNQLKVKCVSAGFSNCYALMDNKAVYSVGANATTLGVNRYFTKYFFHYLKITQT